MTPMVVNTRCHVISHLQWICRMMQSLILSPCFQLLLLFPVTQAWRCKEVPGMQNPRHLPDHVGQAATLGSSLPAAAHGVLPSAALAPPYASSLRSAMMDRKSECRGAHDYSDVGDRATHGAVAEDVRERLYLHPLWLIAPAHPCASRCTCIPYGSSLPRIPALRDVPASLQAKKGALGEGAFPLS